ncbi:Tubulin polyglutamylase TTLL4 [Fukomys damarensis]|uniref:Tubulin polyglutamylase TTLL4 n=2 Tax=Fukomys damarensis TaxID=885580 RepID=A0A091DZ34_FUKDA|nr:Tubulin polyglutamylase TTLL4 [Fukomys damarensis]
MAGQKGTNDLNSLSSLFSSTLQCHRSDSMHKPYQQLESSGFPSIPSDKWPFPVPQRRPPVILSEDINTSSTFFPVAPSIPPLTTNSCLSLEVSARKSSRRTLDPAIPGKAAPSQPCKPTLNTNIFLRPNIIEVPLSKGTKGLKAVPPPETHHVVLHHLGTTRNYTPRILDYNMTTSIRTVRDGTSAHITVPTSSSFNASPISVAPSQYNCAQTHPCRLDDNSSCQAPAKEPRFTEAVRLAAKDIEKKPQQGSQLGQSCSLNSNFGWSLLNRSRRWKPPLVSKQFSQGYARLDRKIFPGALNTTGLDSRDRCTKKTNTYLLASHANRLSPRAACGPIIAPLPVGEDKAPIPPIRASPLPPTGVAEVATCSTFTHPVQLGNEKPEEYGALGSPAIGSDNHCQPDQIEADDMEKLVDDLEISSSPDKSEQEKEDESDPLNAVSSTDSEAVVSQGCREVPTKALPISEKVVQPALTASLFPNVAPTIYFGTQNERVEKLPWQQRKLLQWKMSIVTPNIVKQIVARSHFTISKGNDDWLGCWGGHMQCDEFQTIRKYQKYNHFPGSFQIGRKDKLCCNLSRMQSYFGKKEFRFFPKSFILPQDAKVLKQVWESSPSQNWIVKPPASARGIGIKVIHEWSQLPKRRPLLVQKYLQNPYLINGTKFDLRLYVYITSYDPLRIYLFSDGLVRFATCTYSTSLKSLGNKFIHLTNYSINKNNTAYQANADQRACQGHKWSLRALWKYLSEKGIKCNAIWKKIKDIVVKTIISSESYVTKLLKKHVRKPYICHELLGFDVILDENLKPWVLEVNTLPSLHTSSPLDVGIKGQMIRDLLNLAGFVLPTAEDLSSTSCTSRSIPARLSSAAKNTRPVESECDITQRLKKEYYLAQKIPDLNIYASVLDVLMPDDVQILVKMEDEFARRGQFQRIFPSHNSFCYLRFFEQPRYFNILAIQWEQKYHSNRAKGLDLLRSWCYKKFHLGDNFDSAPPWSQPTPTLSGPNNDGLTKPGSSKPEKPSLVEDSEDTSKEPNPTI